METTDRPLLGLATTEELIRELIARFTIPATRVSEALRLAEMIGNLSAGEREYRTTDS